LWKAAVDGSPGDTRKQIQVFQVEFDGTLLIVVFALSVTLDPKDICQIHSGGALGSLEARVDDERNICEDHQAQGCLG
jgi:hypothetical protein